MAASKEIFLELFIFNASAGSRLVPHSWPGVLVFFPTSLTDGIELSDDPLPALRTSVYALSFARRRQQ